MDSLNLGARFKALEPPPLPKPVHPEVTEEEAAEGLSALFGGDSSAATVTSPPAIPGRIEIVQLYGGGMAMRVPGRYGKSWRVIPKSVQTEIEMGVPADGKSLSQGQTFRRWSGVGNRIFSISTRNGRLFVKVQNADGKGETVYSGVRLRWDNRRALCDEYQKVK